MTPALWHQAASRIGLRERAGWFCDRCKTPLYDEPESVCTYRQTASEPAEYELDCPECGYQGWIVERDGPMVFRRKKTPEVGASGGTGGPGGR